jgi:hypothetical protein
MLENSNFSQTPQGIACRNELIIIFNEYLEDGAAWEELLDTFREVVAQLERGATC